MREAIAQLRSELERDLADMVSDIEDRRDELDDLMAIVRDARKLLNQQSGLARLLEDELEFLSRLESAAVDELSAEELSRLDHMLMSNSGLVGTA